MPSSRDDFLGVDDEDADAAEARDDDDEFDVVGAMLDSLSAVHKQPRPRVNTGIY